VAVELLWYKVKENRSRNEKIEGKATSELLARREEGRP
jgi:hypothetical protein